MEMLEVTVTVTDVDENVAPAFPSATATRSIAENTAANTNIGDPVAATDPNGDTLTYSLEGTDAASFGIDGSTGQLSTLAALDFETKTAYTVVVKATDPDGLSDTIDVTINVTDVDENVAPAFPSATATRSIAENTAANTNIGDPVAATDPNGDTLTYSLEGTDAASFGIDGSTGQLRTSAALDFETKTPYTVVVKATDPDGLSDTIDVTINVTDVDDGAVTPVDSVGRYDTNGTEGIQIDELFDAIDDYFDGKIGIDRVVRSHRRLLRVTQPTVGCQVFSWYPTADEAVMCAARPQSHWDRRKDEAYVNEFSAKGRRVLYAAPPRGLSRRMDEYESTAWQTYRPRPGLAGSVAGHLSCNGCLLRGSSDRTHRYQEFFRQLRWHLATL